MYRNLRKLGGVWLVGADEVGTVLGGLGPDALGLGRRAFLAQLATRRGQLKAALLDQSFVAGVGHLIADEALWQARLPTRVAGSTASRRRRPAGSTVGSNGCCEPRWPPTTTSRIGRAGSRTCAAAPAPSAPGAGPRSSASSPAAARPTSAHPVSRRLEPPGVPPHVRAGEGGRGDDGPVILTRRAQAGHHDRPVRARCADGGARRRDRDRGPTVRGLDPPRRRGLGPHPSRARHGRPGD